LGALILDAQISGVMIVGVMISSVMNFGVLILGGAALPALR
jgi:hypothetical protein